MPATPGPTPDPATARAWLELGESLEALQRPAEALACHARAVEADPGSAQALLRLACVAQQVGDPVLEPAVEALLGLAPPARVALRTLATALSAGGRQALALRCMSAGLEGEGEAEAGAADHAVFAELLAAAGEVAPAEARYRRAIDLAPDWPELHNNRALLLRRMGDDAAARAAFERALALREGYVAARYNLGNLLSVPGSVDAARDCYERVLALQPAHAGALHGLGQLVRDPEQRIDLFGRALAADPGQVESLAALVEAKLAACDWAGLDPAIDALREAVRSRPDAPVAPFGFLGLAASPDEQQRCARNWVRSRLMPRVRTASAGLPPFVHRADGRSRLRIGYLSADFRDHVMGRLLVDLFPAHDRSRVSVVGLSCGPDDGSAVRERLRAGCDAFLDLSSAGIVELATRIHAAGIDVLVDLTGFTEGSRSEALALRPAPVQASWLGYPGTMGAPFIDALFCDPVLVPPAHQPWYDETLVPLDGVYQPAPALPPGGPPPAPDVAGRAALGLPPGGVVFASFNASHKLRPAMFECWLRILSRVDGSVLWLSVAGAAARGRLQAFAAARGVDPARLVFAPIVPFEAHQARLPAADLFLDALPYSAGATASQCIAAGVPLLALTGDTYVGRMSTAILAAIGCADLACDSVAGYEALAAELGCDRNRLQAVRDRVRAGAIGSPLFSPRRQARAVEEACFALWHAFCTSSRHGQQPEQSLPQPGGVRQSLP